VHHLGKVLGRVAAVGREQDLSTAGVVVDPLADVVDEALERDPVVPGRVVPDDLVPAVLGELPALRRSRPRRRPGSRLNTSGVGGRLVIVKAAY